jgi:hypothetical protein
VDEPPRCIEQVAGEHDMPNNLPIVVSNDGQTLLAVQRTAQVVDKRGHDRTIVPERQAVDLGDGCVVTSPLPTNQHMMTLRPIWKAHERLTHHGARDVPNLRGRQSPPGRRRS